MNKKALKYLKQSIFLILGIVLIWFTISNSNITFDEFWEGAKSMNYWYFGISAAFAILSHYSRALRWKLLINSTGYDPKTKNVFASVLFMYASNIAIPRSGEIARCGTLYKYESIPVPQLLGTVIIERTFDLLTLLFFTGILFIVQFDFIEKIIARWDDEIQKSTEGVIKEDESITPLIILIIIGVVIVTAIIVYRKKIKFIVTKIYAKAIELKKGLISSVKSVMKMKKKLLFLLHTMIIWIGYVAMFYICFFAFEPTSELGLAVGFTAFIAGSFGMVAPTQGGVGAWHIMVGFALEAYMITPNLSNAALEDIEKAIITWTNVAFGVMTITIAAAGIISFAVLPIMNKNEKLS